MNLAGCFTEVCVSDSLSWGTHSLKASSKTINTTKTKWGGESFLWSCSSFISILLLLLLLLFNPGDINVFKLYWGILEAFIGSEDFLWHIKPFDVASNRVWERHGEDDESLSHKPGNYLTPVLLALIINLVILAKVSELCMKEAPGLSHCHTSHPHSSIPCQAEVIQTVIELWLGEGTCLLNVNIHS